MSFSRIIAVCITFLLLSSAVAEAQTFRKFRNRYNQRMYRHGQVSFTAGAGLSTYFGDLKANETDLWAKPSIQLGLMYRYNNHLHFRSELTWYRISGADSLNDFENTIVDRNLSFRSDNFEWNVVALWQFYNKYSRYNRPTLNPYAFAGTGITTNNPKTRYEGEWVALQPLETEGVNYGRITLVIPAGLGLTYHASPKWDISAEFGYRITFTDYLDDASTNYRDPESFGEDELARELADRRDELGYTPRYTGSNYRGNPSNNDWYLITGLKVNYSPGAINNRRYRRSKYR
ncbi:DUF6089 family protein [Nafulsella turpanensis]|uniref:DUF6089 family protein n=1 Tax=Nafulsella turpanensis TaxID=1265690 RepID=UPI0009D918E2|nr:DUF6089 family protein [Nafulsella turpanensis]